MADFRIEAAGAEGMARFREWSEDEQWNPGTHDAGPFLAADPHGFFLGHLEGRPIACVSAVRYGADYGFLGFYIARPDFRGQGYGIRMWHRAMTHLAGRNVGLDGVIEQQDNYRRSGFRRAWNHVRYEGVPPLDAATSTSAITLVDARTVPFDRLAAYDRRFFPAARDAFLSQWVVSPTHTALAAVADGHLQGFAVLRPAAVAPRIGPLYASSPDVARALLTGLAAAVPGSPVAIDVPDINTASVRLVESLGLDPTFEAARMYTGPTPDIDTNGIYATTTLELG